MMFKIQSLGLGLCALLTVCTAEYAERRQNQLLAPSMMGLEHGRVWNTTTKMTCEHDIRSLGLDEKNGVTMTNKEQTSKKTPSNLLGCGCRSSTRKVAQRLLSIPLGVRRTPDKANLSNKTISAANAMMSEEKQLRMATDKIRKLRLNNSLQGEQNVMRGLIEPINDAMLQIAKEDSLRTARREEMYRQHMQRLIKPIDDALLQIAKDNSVQTARREARYRQQILDHENMELSMAIEESIRTADEEARKRKYKEHIREHRALRLSDDDMLQDGKLFSEKWESWEEFKSTLSPKNQRYMRNHQKDITQLTQEHHLVEKKEVCAISMEEFQKGDIVLELKLKNGHSMFYKIEGIAEWFEHSFTDPQSRERVD